MHMNMKHAVDDLLKNIQEIKMNPLDMMPGDDLVEKMINLVLMGPPPGPSQVTSGLADLAGVLSDEDVTGLNVVVFGGGTGLSNVIGGDSRTLGWPRNPFQGIKEVFPHTRAVVCVTDDGGSTGELLKDMPLIALGDLRHVLLSSVRREKLQEQYKLTEEEAYETARNLHVLFNYRFVKSPASPDDLATDCRIDFSRFPEKMHQGLREILNTLYTDQRLGSWRERPHCLGNLLLAAAIYQAAPGDDVEADPTAIITGLQNLAEIVGAEPEAILPCTTTPASLKILYANGCLVTGENKSGHARRGYPMDRVFVEFAGEPQVPEEVTASIDRADIILFAPGSLYTSIIPILQVPGIARAVRDNTRALKILVANLWIQQGETDIVRDDPGRRFYVSDLIKAYHRNIPGGVKGLFHEILALRLQDIPGSVLQNYAVEGKMPIYLDNSNVREMGFIPVESRIFSASALEERRVIQHDPAALAKVVKTLWVVKDYLSPEEDRIMPPAMEESAPIINPFEQTPDQRFRAFGERIRELELDPEISRVIVDIFWHHKDIPVQHLDNFRGIILVDLEQWKRCQEWDNIFSFYDPEDAMIKIRKDVFARPYLFEMAFLIALGQSLLGNYALNKQMCSIDREGEHLGKVFELILRKSEERNSFLNPEELDEYLQLARMKPSGKNHQLYTRLVSGSEGFTPPGLLFGLTYCWYLDNRFAAHIEYKMGIIRTEVSDLIPEQVKIFKRRLSIIDFFRKVVFRNTLRIFNETLFYSDSSLDNN
ncbi:2-phospho-L-lactate transferase CofD family protein [Thermodesulfobacteriota bacterium]